MSSLYIYTFVYMFQGMDGDLSKLILWRAVVAGMRLEKRMRKRIKYDAREEDILQYSLY